jgi:hypothetical protein
LLHERDAGITLLLERIAPGGSLDDEDLPWDQKLGVIAGLVARVHAAGTPPVSTPTLADHAAVWRVHVADDPGLVRELDTLVADEVDEVLLHGDLHPGNALRGRTVGR